MRYVSMCSGIEAASVAWEPLGFEPIALAEVEEFPSAVLRERFPTVPNVGDLTSFDWGVYSGAADIVVAGVPCQSFSIAGPKDGLGGERGQLMLEFLRACEKVGPEWVVIENVPNILSIHGGKDFQAILETMVGMWPRGGHRMEGSGCCLLLASPKEAASVRCHQHSGPRRCRRGTT